MTAEIQPAAPEAEEEEETVFISDEPLVVGDAEFIVLAPSAYIDAGYSGILLIAGEIYLHRVNDGKMYRQEIVKEPKSKGGALRAIKKATET